MILKFGKEPEHAQNSQFSQGAFQGQQQIGLGVSFGRAQFSLRFYLAERGIFSGVEGKEVIDRSIRN